MKKVYLLSGMCCLFALAININAAQKLSEKQRMRLETAQGKKSEHQRELARPPVYKMIDAAIEEEYNVEFDSEGNMIRKDILKVDWQAIFKILDSMRGVIGVNEYRTWLSNLPLLWIAVKQKNLLAVKTLLEKYKANPNFSTWVPDFEDDMTSLMLARKLGDTTIVNLLIKYGAK